MITCLQKQALIINQIVGLISEFSEWSGKFEQHDAEEMKLLKHVKEQCNLSKNVIMSQMQNQSSMSNFINDLLDLQKLSNNKFVIKKNNFNLCELVHNVMSKVFSKANLNEIKLQATIDDPKDLDFIQCIFDDQGRYSNFLQNFISNALTYSFKNGEITVKIKILEKQRIKDLPNIGQKTRHNSASQNKSK